MKRLLLLLVIATAFLSSCARSGLEPGVFIDPSLATLVPGDTVLMAGVRIDLLVQTPVYKKYIADGKFPVVEKFSEQTGINPEKDLWQLVYVSNGKQNVLLGRGKFASDLEPELERQGMKRSGYKSFPIFGEDDSAVAFINSTTAAAGDMSALHSLIDQMGKSHGPPPALAGLLKEIPRESQVWAAYAGGPIDIPIPDGNFTANAKKMMSSIQNGSVYLDLSGGLKGLAIASCTNDQNAQQVHDALQAFIGLGRLTTPTNQPDMLKVYDGLRVTQESSKVKLYVEEPEELVNRILTMVMPKR